MTTHVSYHNSASVASITIDDGKVNAMGIDLLTEIHGAFDQAEADDAVVVLTGRDGIFSAGFDLQVFAEGPQASVNMMLLGAELTYRIMSFPRPVIVACSGHALPMGAFLMLAADTRIGVAGDFKIGLNEVAIGLTVPQFAIELARHRLTPAAFQQAVVNARMHSPTEAVEAGFLDHVVAVEDLNGAAGEAGIAAVALDPVAHHATKLKARSRSLKALRLAIDSELTLDNMIAAQQNKES